MLPYLSNRHDEKYIFIISPCSQGMAAAYPCHTQLTPLPSHWACERHAGESVATSDYYKPHWRWACFYVKLLIKNGGCGCELADRISYFQIANIYRFKVFIWPIFTSLGFVFIDLVAYSSRKIWQQSYFDNGVYRENFRLFTITPH